MAEEQSLSEAETIARLCDGDLSAVNSLLSQQRPLLRRMIELRMDKQMRQRVDASDVIQEAQVEISQRLDDFLERRPMPLSLWIRQTAYQAMLRLRRVHVETQKRSTENEVALPDHSSVILAAHLLNTPSEQLMKREMIEKIQAAIASLSGTDRELVLMRNYEELSNAEAAALVGLTPEAASKRYTRALLKLRTTLQRTDS